MTRTAARGRTARHATVLTATLGISLLAGVCAPPALARLVEGDGATVRPAATARVTAQATDAVRAAPALGTLAGEATGVACGLVRDLRVCTHGDDAHLAGASSARGEGGSTASTSSTRIGCYSSGPRVQTVYARPVTGRDRYASSLTSFRGWAGAVEKTVDDSARKTKGARHVRFVSTPSGSSCVLSVLNLALPAQAFGSFSAMISALQDKGLDDPHTKYLVWADSSVYCGVASGYHDDKPSQDNLNNGAFPTYARVDRPCWGQAEAHELMHMLGAVQPAAPNATGGLHCRDGADVMCYDDRTAGSTQKAVCPSSHAALLDCRSDDYFSTSPPAGSWLARHWNTAHSAFLARGWTDPAPSSAAPSSPSPKPAASPATTPPPDPQQPRPGLPVLPLPLPTLLAGRS